MNQTINSKNLDSRFHCSRSFGGVSLLGFSITFLLILSGCGQKGDTDPLLGEFTFDVPIAYVKRPVDAIITTDADGNVDFGNANPRNAYQYKPGPTGEGGGNLYVREFASNTAKEYNLTANARGDFPGTAPQYDTDGTLLFEAGDVADLDVSYDGKRIVFAFRPGDPPNTDPEEQSKWDLWEYVFPTDPDGKIINLHQGTFLPVMTGAGTGDISVAQQGNDIDPTYLPDGSIVFSSDRVQRKAALVQTYTGGNIADEPLLDESRNEPAMNLHIIFPGLFNNTTIKQISFNQSHELDPTVTSTGKIVYTRWEHASKGDNASPFPLFQISVDGTGHDVLYGAHTFTNVDTGVAAFLQTREAQDGSLIATRMARLGSYLSGDLVKIDYKNYVDVNTRRSSASGSGVGHVSVTNVTPLGGYSSEGRFATPFPLWDDTGRMLVAWAYCEVQDQNGNRELCSLVDNPTDTNVYSPAPPGFGIWMLHENGVTMTPIVLPEDGWSITDPIAIVDRISSGDYPDVGYDLNATPEACSEDSTLCSGEFGLLKIDSVYDTDDLAARGLTALRGSETLTCKDSAGTIVSSCASAGVRVSIPHLQDAEPDQRPVRFIRIIGPALVVQDTNSTGMREILGYHVVEPDGSVVTKVPAGRPFSFELTDKMGHRFSTHPATWLQVQTGEVLHCTGCHAGHSQTAPLYSGSRGGAAHQGTTPLDPLDPANNPLLAGVNETMAETLDRVSCADGAADIVDGVNGCGYRNLSGDLVFRDIWNDPADTDPDNADFSIPYNSMNLDTNHLNVPPPPVDINSPCFLLWGSGAFCNPNKIATRFPVMAFEKARFAEEIDERQVDCINGNWVATCRIAINYETHIQTIWEKNRWLDVGDVDDMGNPVGFSNYPCIRCHREFNRNDPSLDNPTMVDIPDGQLNLTRTGSHQVRIDSDQFESFLELTGGDDLQKLNATLDGLEYVTEVVVDPNDPNNTQVQNVSVNRCTEQPTIFPQINDVEKCGSGDAMDRGRGGNRNYGYFYSKMTTFDPNRDQIDHSVMLNQAELKMINEWIELGRRYWGDPIDQRDEPPATADTYQ